MPASDKLIAAREKVLDWGPDLRRPGAMVRFRDDVRELERLAAADVLVSVAVRRVTGAHASMRPLPAHRGRMQSLNGEPWVCADCGWIEGDEPREHGEEPAT